MRACEEQVEQNFAREKRSFSEQRIKFQKFTREDLFKLFENLKSTISHDGDYAVPEEVLNYRMQN